MQAGVLAHGGTFGPDGTFTAPYLFSTWVHIKLAAGRTGFVDRRFLRSPVDYRVNFAKLDGRWQLVFFLAGD